MIVLRLCAGFIVWFTILAANFLLLAVALYCYSKAGLITASGAVGKVGYFSKTPVQHLLFASLLGTSVYVPVQHLSISAPDFDKV